MKAIKLLTGLIAAVAALSIQVSAVTLAVGDARNVGSIVPGTEASEINERGYINIMIGLAPQDPNLSITDGDQTITRFNSLHGVPLPTATGGSKTEFEPEPEENVTVNVTGFTYLLAKYDAGNDGSFVWYIAGLTSVDVPFKNVRGLSHYTLFGGETTTVPDGGATAALLGLGLLGLAGLRRKS